MLDDQVYLQYENLEDFVAYLNYNLQYNITDDLVFAAIYSVMIEQITDLSDYHIEIVILGDQIADLGSKAPGHLKDILNQMGIDLSSEGETDE